MNHPWMAGHLAFPFCLSIYGCHSYCAIHGPSMDGRPPCLPPLCLSIRGCQSYCAIHGPSMDGQSCCLPPSVYKYLWMPELLCHPWTIHGWPATLPSRLCLSIRGCQSYCAVHGPSMDGRPPCLYPSKYPWMPELLCHPLTIHGWPVTNCERTVKEL